METVQIWLQRLQGHGPLTYALLMGLLVSCGIGAPINEDLLLIGAAAVSLYAAAGLDVVPLIAVGILGVVLGDLLIFHWGYRYGVKLTRTRLFSKVVSEKKLLEFQKRFQEKGQGFLFVTRFLPGIRTPIFFAAGTLKLSYKKLLILDFAAALIQVPALVLGVRYVGGNTDQVLHYLERFQYLLLALCACVGAYFLFKNRNKSRVKSPRATR